MSEPASFRVEGPPYPTNLPFYQTEALTWLLNNKNRSALAGNRFHNTKEAIEAVKKLYEAGAKRVEVVVTHCEAWRRVRDGGDYADTLVGTFPARKRSRVMSMIESLEPYEGGAEVKLDPGPGASGEVTWALWWD